MAIKNLGDIIEIAANLNAFCKQVSDEKYSHLVSVDGSFITITTADTKAAVARSKSVEHDNPTVAIHTFIKHDGSFCNRSGTLCNKGQQVYRDAVIAQQKAFGYITASLPAIAKP